MAGELGAFAAKTEQSINQQLAAALMEMRAEMAAIRQGWAETKLLLMESEQARAAEQAERLATIKDGEPGRSVTMDDVAPMIVSEVARVFATVPVPKDGLDGAPGRDGIDGVAGKDGAPGRDGLDGKDGIDGKDGVDGAPGRDGEQGPPGRDGVDGINGKDGAPGVDGRDGLDGSHGKDGVPGADGRDGTDGRDGIDGQPGMNGKDGLDGAPGRDGADGTHGKDGADGAPGRDGVDGMNGKDGESINREEVLAMVRDVVDTIPVPKDGKDVDPELVAQMVDATVAKAVAALPSPERGEPGPAGKLGRVLAWEDRVHYQGDTVSHAGAVFQAVRDTGRPPPHDDWDCIIPAAERGADGKTPVFRGTWSRDDEYRSLDVVALNGGSFVALNDDPGECPGAGWQLLAGGGSRGKPGEAGRKGDPGPAGPGIVGTQVGDDGVVSIRQSDGSVVKIDLYPVLIKLRG